LNFKFGHLKLQTCQDRSKFGWSFFSDRRQTHSKKQYQENGFWPRKPRQLRPSEDMKIHKKVSGQENNLFLTTDTQLFTLLIFLFVEERIKVI